VDACCSGGGEMTDDDILRMAIECQLVTTGNREGIYAEALMRFARMAMQHEREKCAKLCDKFRKESASHWPLRFANMIRARSNT
jgi:hypothetical protein